MKESYDTYGFLVDDIKELCQVLEHALVAFQNAGVEDLLINKVSLDDSAIAAKWNNHFKPIEGGRKIVIVPAAGKTEARRLLRQYGKYSKD